MTGGMTPPPPLGLSPIPSGEHSGAIAFPCRGARNRLKLVRMRSPRSQPAQQLTVELERASLRALQQVYDEANRSLFKGQLRRPQLLFVEGNQRLGQWCSEPRQIELSRALVLEQGWGVLVEVLKHEMAHQYVEEVLVITGEGPHGQAFRQICEERAIDAKAAGLPKSGPIADEQQRVLSRIAKLLSLAQSTDLHEAETAMSLAQRLMLKYNLEHALQPASRGYRFEHIGRPTGRVGESERLLAALLAEHFFVEVIWVPVWRPLEGKRGSVLEVCGTHENLEFAGYVHAFLIDTADRLWSQYRAERNLRSNAERREFISGVMAGFRDKLAREKRQQQKEGLVWVGDAELSHYLKRRHPHIRWMRGSVRQRPESWSHGKEAGKKIVLHKPMKSTPSSAPKLLPGR